VSGFNSFMTSFANSVVASTLFLVTVRLS